MGDSAVEVGNILLAASGVEEHVAVERQQIRAMGAQQVLDGWPDARPGIESVGDDAIDVGVFGQFEEAEEGVGGIADLGQQWGEHEGGAQAGFLGFSEDVKAGGDGRGGGFPEAGEFFVGDGDGDADGDFLARENVQVAENQVALGEDIDREPGGQEELAAAAGELVMLFDRLPSVAGATGEDGARGR